MSISDSLHIRAIPENDKVFSELPMTMMAASLLPDPRNSCCSDSWSNYDRTFPSNASIISEDQTTGVYLNNATLSDREYYNVWYRIIGSFFLSLIFAIGCTGNAMVVVVVWRCRSMHTPTNCYLVSLAVADLLLLFWATLPTLVEYNMVIDEHISGPVGCSIMVFIQYLGVNVSSLSITALTVERYIAICHPMRAHTICTISRAKRIIAGLWIAGLTYSAPWLALATTHHRRFSDGSQIEYCTFRLPRHDYMIYYLADLILMYAVPLAVNCVLYGLIAWTLYANTVTRTNGTGGGTGPLVPNSPYLDTLGRPNQMVSQVMPPRNGGTAIRLNKSTSTISSRVQVIKMLAAVVCLFAVLWLPYRVYVVYNSFARVRFEDLWLLLLCRVMVYINSAVNPILYNAMSVKFRRSFSRVLSCGKVTEPPVRMYGTQASHVTWREAVTQR